MKRIYLAIPFSGMEEESFRQANIHAGKLMTEGHIVFSPISHSWPIAQACALPEDWEFWKQFDETFIEWCDEMHVLCLPGWRESVGVQAEIKIAERMAKPVVLITVVLRWP